MCGGDIGGDEQRKGESKDGGEFMILNTTYCRRAFTGVYCEHMATTHVKITSEQGVRDESEALCEQLRVVDKSRLGRRVGKITDESVMTDITRKIKVVCGC